MSGGAGNISDRINLVIDKISELFIGDREVLVKILAAILAGGHVLMEDVPGMGKTFLSKILAKVLGLRYSRIQFTPPTFCPATSWAPRYGGKIGGAFETVLGPIFSNFVLADEINRASPPKVQSALLEAMQEGQVTIEGETMQLPNPPFIVIATQNPIELEGTYPLPEAQLDSS